jgi:hypothetical protein
LAQGRFLDCRVLWASGPEPCDFIFEIPLFGEA